MTRFAGKKIHSYKPLKSSIMWPKIVAPSKFRIKILKQTTILSYTLLTQFVVLWIFFTSASFTITNWKLKKTSHFGSLIRWSNFFFCFRVTNSNLKNIKLHFEFALIFFFWGWNIKVRCTTRFYSWSTPFCIICKWSSSIIIRYKLLFVCRWHLHILPTWGR